MITPNSPFDRYVAGNKKAISPSAVKGFKLVQEVGCLSCHSGANFSGPDQQVGVGNFQKFPVHSGSEYDSKYNLTADLGRYEVTKKDGDKNTWRVPTWRNIAVTAPYFHNGSVSTLDEAVKVMAKTQLAKDLKAEEVKDIVAFLESLTGTFPAQKMPLLPKSLGRVVIE